MDSSHFYTLNELGAQKLKKFNFDAHKYLLTFHNLNEIEDLEETLHNIFTEILQKVFADRKLGDYASVKISHPRLNNDHYIPFRPYEQITAERLLTQIEFLVQPDEEISMEDSLTIEFARIKRKRGGRP